MLQGYIPGRTIQRQNPTMVKTDQTEAQKLKEKAQKIVGFVFNPGQQPSTTQSQPESPNNSGDEQN